MAAVLPLVGESEPVDWSTFAVLGIVVGVLGLGVFLLAGGPSHPSTGLVYGSFILSLFLIGLGGATAAGSLVVRDRQNRAAGPA